jgi:hypothetical protein
MILFIILVFANIQSRRDAEAANTLAAQRANATSAGFRPNSAA